MREKQLILPMDYSIVIADDEPVRLLDEILDELDYTQLYEMYSSKGRKPAVPPVILFKVCLLSMLHHKKFRYVVADAGYDSEENFTWLAANNYALVIKPSMYETKKKRSYKEQFWRLDNLSYDEGNDEYICAKGRRLRFTGIHIQKTGTGFKREAKKNIYENCRYCGLRRQCQKTRDGSVAKSNKQMLVPTNYLKLQDDNMQRFKSELGTQLRVNRSIQPKKESCNQNEVEKPHFDTAPFSKRKLFMMI